MSESALAGCMTSAPEAARSVAMVSLYRLRARWEECHFLSGVRGECVEVEDGRVHDRIALFCLDDSGPTKGYWL